MVEVISLTLICQQCQASVEKKYSSFEEYELKRQDMLVLFPDDFGIDGDMSVTCRPCDELFLRQLAEQQKTSQSIQPEVIVNSTWMHKIIATSMDLLNQAEQLLIANKITILVKNTQFLYLVTHDILPPVPTTLLKMGVKVLLDTRFDGYEIGPGDKLIKSKPSINTGETQLNP